MVQNEMQNINQTVMSKSETWENRVGLLPRSGNLGVTIKKTRENIIDQNLIREYCRRERTLGKVF